MCFHSLYFAYVQTQRSNIPSFSYPSQSCIRQILTYHIIMPCLSKPSIQIHFVVLLSSPLSHEHFYAFRMVNVTRQRASIAFAGSDECFFHRSAFDMQSGFALHFGKVHVILSLRIDYKLASIALNSHYFFYDIR